MELNISHNLLRRLPQDIKNVKSLKILDVSHNFLICLPEIRHLNLEVIDISMNLFENASETIRMIPRYPICITSTAATSQVCCFL